MGQFPSAGQIPNTNSQGVSIFKIPNNSGSIDIDVSNLQRCINYGLGSTCITHFVQGYDTTTNMFVPSTLATQGFELVEQNKNFNNESLMTLVVLIVIVLLVTLT